MNGLAAVALLIGVAFTAAGQIHALEGKKDSPVRVIIYEDLACSDCADFRVMLDQKLLPKYGDRVVFEHRDFPLAKHPWSRRAAIAARYFAGIRPELGIIYRRQTLANLGSVTIANFEEKLSAFATANGVAPPEAVAALSDPHLAELVEKDYQEGVARGVVKTPTVFVDSTPFVEQFSSEQISKSIDQALAQ